MLLERKLVLGYSFFFFLLIFFFPPKESVGSNPGNIDLNVAGWQKYFRVWGVRDYFFQGTHSHKPFFVTSNSFLPSF